MTPVLVAFALNLLPQPGLPPGLSFDDGFSWFECHNFESVSNNVVNGEWVLESSVRIFGKMPDRSGFRFKLTQNGKTISDQLTDGYPIKLGSTEPNGMVILGHWKDSQRTTASGPMVAEVFYIDGNTNKEYLAKSCKLDVRKVSRVRGPVKRRDPYAPAFYINRHSEALSSILYFREYEFPSYIMKNGLPYYSERVVELLFNYSETQDIKSPALGRLVVEVNGQPISMRVPNNEVIQDQMGFGDLANKYTVEHSDRDAAKYFNGGPAYSERIGFVRRSMLLPLHWGAPLEGRPKSKVFTTDHPGNWKITWLIDRKPIRTFRFKIGADGLPVPHAEQKSGLVLAPNAVLVDTEIPAGGAPFDGRLTPTFVQQGAFYGRPWATSEMKSLAAKVPTVGKPFPVSSAGK